MPGPRFDPWRHVDADDELVADLLAGTVDLVVDLGGWVHPSARFVVRDGEAHVETDAGDGEPLVRLPASAFVPIGRVTWAEDPLAFGDDADVLSAEQWELLTLQVALHTACRKLDRLRSGHPALAADLGEPVVRAVRAFRPSFRAAVPSAASVLWSNRAFRLPASAGAEPEPMALPLVDLLDHRRGGATGTWTGDAFEVGAVVRDGQAFLDYGLERDAIGMAVVYGFADASASVAHAAPMELEVDGVGPVRIDARGRAADATLLPTWTRREEDVTVVSHLPFRRGNRGGLAERVGSTEIVDAVLEANLALCSDLVDAATEDRSVAASVLSAAATIQASVLASSPGSPGSR